MRIVFRISAIVAASAIIAGCGQSGPLYLPTVPPLPAKPTEPKEAPPSDVTPGAESAGSDSTPDTPDTSGTPLMLTPELPASGDGTASAPTPAQ